MEEHDHAERLQWQPAYSEHYYNDEQHLNNLNHDNDNGEEFHNHFKLSRRVMREQDGGRKVVYKEVNIFIEAALRGSKFALSFPPHRFRQSSLSRSLIPRASPATDIFSRLTFTRWVCMIRSRLTLTLPGIRRRHNFNPMPVYR